MAEAELQEEPGMELVGSSFGSASWKWYGGVLSPQGMIYGIPRYSDMVLRIDPATDTTALVGSSLGSGDQKWYGGVLSPQGMIYGIPSNSDMVLRIDPATDTTALVGSSLGSGSDLPYQWHWWTSGIVILLIPLPMTNFDNKANNLP
jgi:hypothetical protein